MGEATAYPPLADQLLNLKLVINPSEAESLARSHGFSTVADFLPTLVDLGRRHARIPISAFPVCAAALTSDGSVFLGVNLEFPGLPLHHSVHAEQFLLTNLSLHLQPRPDLLNVVVSAFPCGHCRQFLQEIRSAPSIKILVPPKPGPDSEPGLGFQPLSYLLPNRFGPDDLLADDVPLILETHNNGLDFNGEIEKSDLRPLANAALEAANLSHAPYSACPSGVALMDVDGKIYKGSYMESAAYNPSMPPVQAAIVAFVVAEAAEGGRGYDRIAAAALVEKEGAMVTQEETVRLFFKAVAPNCQFHVFHCNDSSSSSFSELNTKVKVVGITTWR
ncbi:hypothetical protein V2J09_003251 [Rumex salicifolius]